MSASLRVILLLIAGLVLVIVIALQVLFPLGPSYSYRYKITVDVSVNGVIRSGSSVIAVKVTEPAKSTIAPNLNARVDGEAVFIDLGNGRNLIALLATGQRAENIDYSYLVVPTTFNVGMSRNEFEKAQLAKGEREVAEDFLPTFATFLNLDDPTSFQFLSRSDFQRVFGPGVRLKSVLVELTDLPVTHQIAHRFPWWNRDLSKYLKANPNPIQWHRALFERNY